MPEFFCHTCQHYKDTVLQSPERKNQCVRCRDQAAARKAKSRSKGPKTEAATKARYIRGDVAKYIGGYK